jgi:ArsR family transcriptional regulator
MKRMTARKAAAVARRPGPPGAEVVPIATAADDDLAAMCKALGHPVRLQIVRMLARHGKCYFGSIADAVAVAPSTASQHLSVLKDAGLIKGWADEQRSCYCVDQERLTRLTKLVGGL